MDLDEIVIHAPIIHLLENVDIPRRLRFHIRDNPFEELTDQEFIRLFRLNKRAARNLLNIVEPHLIPPTRISAMDAITKVIIIIKNMKYKKHIHVHK